MSRATKAYVSAYDLVRIQAVRVRRQEKREMVGDFNAALPEGVTIASATWACNSPWVTFLSNPTIDANGRTTRVISDFQNWGAGAIKVTITTTEGDIHNQVFQCQVRDFPWFNDIQSLAAGPYSVTVIA